MNKRIDYIDISKGIAIIAVVVNHALSNASSGYLVDHPILLNWVNFFCVTTFFFVNGFLYKENSVEHPSKSILRKFKAYYIPFLSYNLFFLLFHNFFIHHHILSESFGLYSAKEYLLAFISLLFGKMQPLTGPAWFLRALIVISISYIVIDTITSKLIKGNLRYYIIFLFSVILLICGIRNIVPSTFNIDDACKNFIIYFFGVIYRKYDINKYVNSHSVAISAASLVISVIIANSFMVGIDGAINPFMNYISQFVSILFVISFSQIPLFSDSKLLRFLGTCSLEIMMLHFLSFKAVSYFLIKLFSFDIEHLADIPVIMIQNVSPLIPALYTIVGICLPSLFFIIKTQAKRALGFSKQSIHDQNSLNPFKRHQ